MLGLQVSRMSRGLKAVCDSNRIRILQILVNGEFCVSELVERLAIDQPKVSHHLAILRGAGIIRSRRDGRHINYSVRPNVHTRMDGPEGPTDVFDLGDLCVSFRFARETATGTGAATGMAGAVMGSGLGATPSLMAERISIPQHTAAAAGAVGNGSMH